MKIEYEEKEAEAVAKRSPADEFIVKARDSLKTVVKEFNYKPGECKEREKNRAELKAKCDNLQVTLIPSNSTANPQNYLRKGLQWTLYRFYTH